MGRRPRRRPGLRDVSQYGVDAFHQHAQFAAEFEEPKAALTDAIYREIRGRIKEDDSGIASPDGPWAYNSRMEEGKQYPILTRTPRDGGPEQILLDCNIEAEGVEYFGFGGGDAARSMAKRLARARAIGVRVFCSWPRANCSRTFT